MVTNIEKEITQEMINLLNGQIEHMKSIKTKNSIKEEAIERLLSDMQHTLNDLYNQLEEYD